MIVTSPPKNLKDELNLDLETSEIHRQLLKLFY